MKTNLFQTVVGLLLKDKSSDGNIIWGTNDYATHGIVYRAECEMTPDTVGSMNGLKIERRNAKARKLKQKRTKEKAEVFTPVKICAKMNAYLDEMINPTAESLQKYITLNVLEFTCGEAPFLVSRYDSTTNRWLSIDERVGLLDKKLRLVSDFTDDEKTWVDCALTALQHTYGYEYQGDNLFNARVNVLCTVVDFYKEKFSKYPMLELIEQFSDIICWNIWQMDGLNDTVPFKCGENGGLFCTILDWDNKQIVEYRNVRGSKFFDFCVGNPPYQEQRIGTSAKALYNNFMDNTIAVGKSCLFVTPARFLFDAGKTPKDWNERMRKDVHFRVIDYEPDSRKIFDDVAITGGVAITQYNADASYEPIEFFTPSKEMADLRRRMKNEVNMIPMFLKSVRFDLPALYNSYPLLCDEVGSDGSEKRITTNAYRFSAFHSAKEPNDVGIWFIDGNRARVRLFINKQFLEQQTIKSGYKVLIPKSGACCIVGDSKTAAPVIGEPFVCDADDGFSQSFVALGLFNERRTAENACRYIKSKFARCLLGIKKVTQHNPPAVWEYVPLQDFSVDSDIDWSAPSADIDRQLFEKYKLTPSEASFIETNISPL